VERRTREQRKKVKKIALRIKTLRRGLEAERPGYSGRAELMLGPNARLSDIEYKAGTKCIVKGTKNKQAQWIGRMTSGRPEGEGRLSSMMGTITLCKRKTSMYQKGGNEERD